ncbi:MFS transporter [Stenotrophomonas sp. NPDC077659]|uniref:MFS transporter n=1 Tax=Stenotrophomonas sp. NPDC077659 TaxID=3390694 RepID=UPI003D078FCA
MKQSESTSTSTLTTQDRTLVATLVLGVTLPLLDTTMVNVGLDAIRLGLNAPISTVQWVVTGYTLAAASSVPASAWLVAKLGQRKLWLSCLWAFLIGSALSAIAPNLPLLIASRVLQGLAAGVLLPTMQTIIISEVGRNRSRAALAAISIPSVLAPILGPPIGGLTLQIFSWHWLFWLHIPICAGAIFAAAKRLPTSKKGQARRTDPIALIALSLALTLTMYGATRIDGSSLHWAFPLLSGIAMLTLFIARATRPESNAPVDLRIFRELNFTRWCSILFLSSMIYYGGAFLLPLMLMLNSGYTPGQAGLMLALHGVGTLVARQKMTAICARWGDRQTTLGAIILIAAGSLLLFPTSLLNHSAIAVGMLIRGAGVGILTIMSMSGAYEDLTPEQVPHASLLSRIMTNAGAAMGAALVATMATSHGQDLQMRNFQVSHYCLWIAIGVCGAVAAWSPKSAKR